MVKSGRPSNRLNDHRAIASFIEAMMADASIRFNELKALIRPRTAAGVATSV